MTDGSDIINKLWNFVMNILTVFGEVWEWLNEPINIPGLGTFTPLLMSAPIIIGLIIWGIFK